MFNYLFDSIHFASLHSLLSENINKLLKNIHCLPTRYKSTPTLPSKACLPTSPPSLISLHLSTSPGRDCDLANLGRNLDTCSLKKGGREVQEILLCSPNLELQLESPFYK